MSALFKYTVGNVESHLVIKHIVEVKYDPTLGVVYIHLINGSIVTITSNSDLLYDELLKKMKDCWKRS